MLNRPEGIADPSWEALTGPYYAGRYDWVARQEFTTPLLDVGCGQGYQATLLCQRFPEARIDCCDIEQGYVDLATEMARVNGCTNLMAAEMNGAALLYPAESFSTVCVFEMLEHVEHPEDVIRSCARVLRPGGVLLVSTPSHGTMETLPGHVQDFFVSDLVAMMRGFEVEAVEKFWPFQMIRARKL